MQERIQGFNPRKGEERECNINCGEVKFQDVLKTSFLEAFGKEIERPTFLPFLYTAVGHPAGYQKIFHFFRHSVNIQLMINIFPDENLWETFYFLLHYVY